MSDNKAKNGNGQAAESKPENPNPYFGIFESIHFSPSDSDRVFENERNGTKSKKLANVAVMLRGGFAAIPGSVYARKPKNGDVYAEVTFIGTQQQTAIKPVDEASKGHLLAWRAWAAQQYAEWRKGQAATSTPMAKTGVAIEGVSID